MAAAGSGPPPPLTGPPTTTAQLQQALALAQQYDSLSQAISSLNVPGVTFTVSLSAPGAPGVSFNGTAPDAASIQALITLLQEQQAAILPQLQAAGITP